VFVGIRDAKMETRRQGVRSLAEKDPPNNDGHRSFMPARTYATTTTRRMATR
jgi:hypothetical protein